MCGLLGYVGPEVPTQTLQKALKSLLHRGPDGSDFYFNPHLFLGHTRLAISDLSLQSAQPMHSACGNYTLIFNGEIYNHVSLRQELKHDTFLTHSDTETLLYAWKKWGVHCIEKLEGMFAFALYEHSTQELYLVRDQMGIKPLYYLQQNNAFYFSSEIKGIQAAAPFVDLSPNTIALQQYTQLLFCCEQHTPWQQIKRVLPGHYLCINTQTLSVQDIPYYTVQFSNHSGITEEKQLIQQLEDLLFQTIEQQHLSHVPVGYLLSGGIDSSAIVALSRAIYPERALQAFTLKPQIASPDYTHTQWVAQHCNIQLEEVNADFPTIQELHEHFERLEEPIGELAPWYTYLLAQRAKECNYKVLLSGHGADELWAGYRRHQVSAYEKYIQHLHILQKPIQQSLSLFSNTSNTVRRLKKWSQALNPAIHHRLAYYFAWMNVEESAQLFNTTTKEIHEHVFEPLMQTLHEQATLSPLQQLLYIDQTQYLPHHNLAYTDKMGMAHGVEIRVPFLQQSMVTFVNALPDHYKLNNGTTKYLLKKVLAKHLPPAILQQSKHGFGQKNSAAFNDLLKNSIYIQQKHTPHHTFTILPQHSFNMHQHLALLGIQVLFNPTKKQLPN